MAKQICIIVTAGVTLILLLVFVNPAAHSQQRFTDNGDGTITDHRLGLIWARADNQEDIDWKQAAAFVKNKFGTTSGSQDDNWRLPTLDELESLYVQNPNFKGYLTECGLVVKIVPQIRLSCVLVWAADVALGSHTAYNFNIGDSFSVPSFDSSGCRALPVRTIE
jgi:hypothetical protein